MLSGWRGAQGARVGMVLVHGRGGSAEDILGLADEFSLSAYAYLAPQAAGNSWYPQSFLAPTEQNEPGLSSGLKAIGRAVQTFAEAGIPAKHVMLGGFSQGACLTLEYVARHPQRYGGVFAYSGALITLEHAGDLAGTPVFLGNSDRDPHIPLDRFQESEGVFEQLKAQVDARIYPDMGHTINKDELDAVRDLMRALAISSLGEE